MNRCQKCHSPLKPSQSFCQQCGTRCDQVLPASAPADASPSNANQCPNCKAPLKPGQSFCQQCGTRCDQLQLASEPAGASLSNTNQCPNCKAPLKSGQSFCQQCGTRCDQPLPASEPAGPANVIPSPAESLPASGEVAATVTDRPIASPLATETLSAVGQKEENPAPESQAKTNTAPAKSKSTSRTGLILAIVVIVLLFIAGGSYFLFKNKKGDESLTQAKTTSSESFETEVEGVYESKGNWGFIQYTGSESGDWVPYYFRTNSSVGREIAKVCKPMEECKIVGQVTHREKMPVVINDDMKASEIFEVIKIKSVEPVKPESEPQSYESEAEEREIKGGYESQGKWGFINEVSPESGDLIQHYFRTNSSVGKQVAQACTPSEDCKVIAEVILKSMNDLPVGMKVNGSAVFEIVNIKSIEPVKQNQASPEPETPKAPAVPAPVANKEKTKSPASDKNRKKPVSNADAATRSKKPAEAEKPSKTEKSGLSKLWKSVKEVAKKGKIEQQKDDAWRN